MNFMLYELYTNKNKSTIAHVLPMHLLSLAMRRNYLVIKITSQCIVCDSVVNWNERGINLCFLCMRIFL